MTNTKKSNTLKKADRLLLKVRKEVVKRFPSVKYIWETVYDVPDLPHYLIGGRVCMELDGKRLVRMWTSDFKFKEVVNYLILSICNELI